MSSRSASTRTTVWRVDCDGSGTSRAVSMAEFWQVRVPPRLSRRSGRPSPTAAEVVVPEETSRYGSPRPPGLGESLHLIGVGSPLQALDLGNCRRQRHIC